jgi:ferredoxin
VKIKVDTALCELHGQCVFLAPELFQIEDDKLIYREDVDQKFKEKAQRAAKACPQLAIKLEE